MDVEFHESEAYLLQYHLSWAWLMSVVEKIEKIGYNVVISYYGCEISEGTPNGDGGKFFKSIVDIDNVKSDIINIEMVWLAVVEFIKWYNQNK